MATKTPLEVPQGATFVRTVQWLEADAVTPVDLTGYTAAMQIRRGYSAVTPVLSLTSPSSGLAITAPERAQQGMWLVTPEHGVTMSAPIICADREAEGW